MCSWTRTRKMNSQAPPSNNEIRANVKKERLLFFVCKWTQTTKTNPQAPPNNNEIRANFKSVCYYLCVGHRLEKRNHKLHIIITRLEQILKSVVIYVLMDTNYKNESTGSS